MKVKISKRTWVIAGTIFVIAFFLFETVAIGFLQFGGRLSNPKQELPESNIIDHELSVEEENTLIGNGITLVKFYFSNNCLECMNQRTYLEFLANNYKDQIFLEELISSRTDQVLPTVLISSIRDTQTFSNITNDELTNKLCDLMVQPPIEFRCAIRGI